MGAGWILRAQTQEREGKKAKDSNSSYRNDKGNLTRKSGYSITVIFKGTSLPEKKGFWRLAHPETLRQGHSGLALDVRPVACVLFV